MKKTKSFQKYIEKRLSKEKIAEIERRAELEAKIIRSIQTSISGKDPQEIFKRKK